MTEKFLAITNPAAGGGKCGKLAGPALERLRAGGLEIETAETKAAGDGIAIAREAYRAGYRKFIAVGGDGTSYEIVNGVIPESQGTHSEDAMPTLGFLPLGTGNSFLRDFADQGIDHATEALITGRERPCDVLRLSHRDRVLHYINLLSVGFAADVAMLRHRKFQAWGKAGYLLSIFLCLARLNRRSFPLRVDGNGDFDRRRCLFLTFNNSKFTGGTMKIAPSAKTDDGLIEYVRWGPIGRLGLIVNLPGLYTGKHMQHPLAERKEARRIDFELDGPVDLMVDGEVLSLECRTIDVLPSALKVMV